MSFAIKEVLITESVDPSCAGILQENGINVTSKPGLKKAELIEEIKKYDGLIVRSATKVTADLIDAADNLKVIGRAGTGVDNIDCDAATRRGILVLNAPGGNALSAAELTCAMIVSLSRNIPEACASLKSGAWDRKKFMGNELFGKTLGIVGLGRIGREVATRMQSFGMRTIGFDPLVPADVSITFGVQSFPLEEMWPLCDYITVHTPLIPQTKNLINTETFSKCKKGVRIINCARGGIVCEDSLLEALTSGQCGGAGLDVYINEPPENNELLQHPKVICTPHLGASTAEAQTRVAEEIAQQFVDIVAGKFVGGIVNSPTFCSSLNDFNRPWVKVSKSLGKIVGALCPKGSKIEGTLAVCDRLLNDKVKMMAVSSLVGILEKQLENGSNFINAPVLAKEAGIEMVPISCESDLSNPSNSSVMLTAKVSDDVYSMVATVQAFTPVMSAINGCAFQPVVPLDGRLIVCRGKSDSNLAVDVITHLASVGKLRSAFMSTPFDDKMWCFFQVSASVPEAPSDLSDIIDFWAELDF